MRNVSGKMKSDVQENFIQNGRPKWEPLAKKTLASKAKRGKGNYILRDSGHLFASLTAAYDAHEAKVTSVLPYARIQHEGGTIKFSPRSGYVNLRTSKSGKLLRQKGHPNLAVFAKARHKRTVAKRWTKASGWSVTIPARPYMLISYRGMRDIRKIIGDGIAAAIPKK